MPQLFIDSDGVAFDFDRQLKNLFGVWPHQVTDDEMWKLIHSDIRFWTEMPVMADFHILWDTIKHLNPIVLTGCHKDNFTAIAEAKVVKWKDHFGHEMIITCLSKDKALHMEQPGDILVDDMSKNLRKWEKAGGIGVLHRSAPDTIEKLRELGII